MHGYMNKEALKLSIETQKAVYWSRSRNQYGKKEKKVVHQKIEKLKLMMIKIV